MPSAFTVFVKILIGMACFMQTPVIIRINQQATSHGRVLDSILLFFKQIISHPNNLFEIMSKEPVKRERNLHNRVQSEC